MLNRFRLFPSNSAITVRPRLACEITVEGVIAARQESDLNSAAITAFTALRPGLLAPGLASPNIPDPAPVVAAIRLALDEVAGRSRQARQISLIIPDLAARVLLLDFDTLPGNQADTLPILRFRLRKLLPFEVEDAAISYQIIHQDSSQVRTVVAVTPRSVLLEYESAVREAGYLPGAVLPSTLASLAVVPSSNNALVVSCSSASVTSAITRGNELLLYRTLDLPHEENERAQELQQVVTVAMAYFEDTMSAPPDALYYSGAGGAEQLSRLLGDFDLPARLPGIVHDERAFAPVIVDGAADNAASQATEGMSKSISVPINVLDLVPTPSTGAATSMPPGLLAGVAGALAN
jgi:type IV pilus assembly protein PilM